MGINSFSCHKMSTKQKNTSVCYQIILNIGIGTELVLCRTGPCIVLFIATCYNIKSATVFICYCNDCCRSSERDRHSEHMDNVRLYHQSLQEQTASQSFHSSSAGDINPSSSILFSALRYQFMDTALFNHLWLMQSLSFVSFLTGKNWASLTTFRNISAANFQLLHSHLCQSRKVTINMRNGGTRSTAHLSFY